MNPISQSAQTTSYQLENNMHVLVQPTDYTPSSLMEWGLMGLNLNLSFQVNNALLSINIQDPHYMSQIIQEALSICMNSLAQNLWYYY